MLNITFVDIAEYKKRFKSLDLRTASDKKQKQNKTPYQEAFIMKGEKLLFLHPGKVARGELREDFQSTEVGMVSLATL